MKSKHAVYVPHTAGRYAQKRFRKAQCPIVERSVPKPGGGISHTIFVARELGVVLLGGE